MEISSYHVFLEFAADSLPEGTLSFEWKLLGIGGAYWQQDASKVQLQRLEAIVFPKLAQLEDHLKALADKSLHDHRKIGQQQALFMFSDLVG